MFLALRDLRFARGRFALMGAVVALIAVLGVLLSGLASGLADAGISGLRALPVTHMAFDETATSEQFSRSTVERKDWQAWSKAPGVKRAEPFGNTLANARVTRGAEKGEQVNLAVFGMAPDSPLAPRPTEGKGLHDGGAGIVITREIADLGVGVGDVLTADRSEVPLKVVGVLDEKVSYGHIGIVYTDLDTWRHLHYGLPGELPEAAREQATAVALTLADGADVAAVEKATGTRADSKETTYGASPGYTAESSTMALIKGFLYAISALVVGAFFTVWTVQRKGEIALLKALGAPTAYILRDALAQVLAVLLGATAVGTAAGLALGSAMIGKAPFSLSAPAIATSAGLLVGLGIVGAVVAVRRITAVDPLTALGATR
ncbi:MULTISPECIES: ABC transporter permease [Streptomyces]|uniref:ABC transporter permease n=1 Tax=Streptomyces griseoaurantiacus TaxID=68213 RepID=A0A7W2HSN1_9ACTN|nr:MULTISPECIES: ABC transporter permease [Streptomyces]MBA5220226.1 ABC transporter permease [Streptomyces griseoaurantiacus]MCF0087586.1 putative ABC transporter permease [Streptomyces sp. MH192]MCF0099673.1 putative ABC transporter permease [Streptomyces sp. MH191]